MLRKFAIIAFVAMAAFPVIQFVGFDKANELYTGIGVVGAISLSYIFRSKEPYLWALFGFIAGLILGGKVLGGVFATVVFSFFIALAGMLLGMVFIKDTHIHYPRGFRGTFGGFGGFGRGGGGGFGGFGGGRSGGGGASR